MECQIVNNLLGYRESRSTQGADVLFPSGMSKLPTVCLIVWHWSIARGDYSLASDEGTRTSRGWGQTTVYANDLGIPLRLLFIQAVVCRLLKSKL